MDSVNDAAAGDIQIAVVRSTEAAVLRRHIVRSFDVTEVLAFCAEYLNPRRRCGKRVARAVNAQTIGAADQSMVGLLLQCVLAEILPILQSPIPLNVVSQQI